MADNVVLDFQAAPVNPLGMPTAQGGTGHNMKTQKTLVQPDAIVTAAVDLYDGGEGIPNDAEMATLRKVSAPMP
jgi:hypothetical protein